MKYINEESIGLHFTVLNEIQEKYFKVGLFDKIDVNISLG